MIKIRKSDERGHFDFGWLDTYHTFSFGDYYDPKFVHFGTMRVLNEDRIEPGKGFGEHPHANMEIITYVVEGALEHKDSTGSSSVIKTGDVQRMTAGMGIIHSEFNASTKEAARFLQIWVYPEKKNLAPSYEQKTFKEKSNRLCLIASHDGRDGSLKIHQNVSIYASELTGELSYTFTEKRLGWVQVIRGSLTCNNTSLSAGDGASIENESKITLKGNKAEFMLFDLI
jgi:hypothetical protein